MHRNRRNVLFGLATLALILFLISGFFKDTNTHNGFHHAHNEPAQQSEPDTYNNAAGVAPLQNPKTYDKSVVKLGWTLFRDPNLSSNQKISCESCHNLQTNGAESQPVSTGVGGQGQRNSLTVFNAALNYRFFWDGRENSLADQIDGPIHDPAEMNSNWRDITHYVNQSSQYDQLFSAAKLPKNEMGVKQALSEFMRVLITVEAPFDQYLRGDVNAINSQQLRGWQAFQNQGCANCHRGKNIGGGMVMRFGYFGQATTGEQRSADTGRHQVTQNPVDMYLFRVASLRNVADTAPYFHDGQTHSLTEAIQIMAKSQLGKQLDSQTTSDIAAFLQSLSGQRPAILKELENE